MILTWTLSTFNLLNKFPFTTTQKCCIQEAKIGLLTFLYPRIQTHWHAWDRNWIKSFHVFPGNRITSIFIVWPILKKFGAFKLIWNSRLIKFFFYYSLVIFIPFHIVSFHFFIYFSFFLIFIIIVICHEKQPDSYLVALDEKMWEIKYVFNFQIWQTNLTAVWAWCFVNF